MNSEYPRSALGKLCPVVTRFQGSEFQRGGVQRDNLAKLDYATIGNTIEEVKLKSVKLNYRKTHHKKRFITQS